MKTYRAGEAIEDFCRACKLDRIHTVMAADTAGVPLRVVCGYCRSEHHYRGGPRMSTSGDDRPATPSAAPAPPVPRAAALPRTPLPIVSDRERTGSPMPADAPTDLEALLRRVIREESGLTPAAPAEKWRGGTLALRPANAALQEKTWPIETFFHKIVMLRNRLRTLEQQLNASELPEDAKIKLQSYVTGCYGSLTSFNVLFAEADDQFRGSGQE
jgi:hypothetical protein